MPIILCDMDGLVADFVSHALRTHGREEVKITSWDIESQLGITKEQFRKPINKKGASWWRSMPEMENWKNIWAICEKYGDESFFCSSPSDFRGATDGKLDWLRDRLGKDFDRLVPTNHKHLLACPDKILIDDSGRNVEAFRKKGHAILYPAPWNSLGEMADAPGYLEEQLEITTKKIRDREAWQEAVKDGSGPNWESDF